MLTPELKQRILSELEERRSNFPSAAKFAVSLGINESQYSRIMKGEVEGVLGEQKWVSLARRLGVSPTNAPKWETAKTPVFQFVYSQLEACQKNRVSSLLCDLSDIGKTYTAKYYADSHKNVVYVDCSQVKTKQKPIRFIAKELGLGGTGRYTDVYDDLVYYIKTLANPLIILDEAGDLMHEAFMELKALWNATDTCCGFYMMGADGLKERYRRSIDGKKTGYSEMFSRFGKKYGCVTPPGREERDMFLQATASMIIKANATTGSDVNVILHNIKGDDGCPSLRRIYTEISKTYLA